MNLSEYQSLLPEITDANRPYWEGLEAGELRLQRCVKCGTFRFPDSPVCPSCLSDESRWEVVSGRGRIWSWITMHQRYFAAFEDELPYTVIFVELEEGPRMMSALAGGSPDPSKLRIDTPVAVEFEPRGEVTVAVFRVAE